MKIEFKNNQDKFQVLEHVIRKTSLKDWEGCETVAETDFLQARLLLKKFEEDTLNFSISYYSAENEFIGLDTADEVFITKSKDRSVTISSALDIPEETARVVVRFIFEDEINADNDFYEILFKIGLTMFVLWLGLKLYQSFLTILG